MSIPVTFSLYAVSLACSFTALASAMIGSSTVVTYLWLGFGVGVYLGVLIATWVISVRRKRRERGGGMRSPMMIE